MGKKIMLLSIKHKTSYSYDQPVQLEPHCLRLTPRSDSYGSLIERSLEITPEPSHLTMSVESDGSIAHWAQFKGGTKEFLVESNSLISLLTGKNPFDFLVYPPACTQLPILYPVGIAKELQPFMNNGLSSPVIKNFAEEVMQAANFQAVDFLVRLSNRIKQDFIYETRLLGVPHRAEDTLVSRKGSCRDYAVLYMAVAKSVGFAVRFVSGYFFEEEPQEPDLHAWVEVYIPGGGWRGFDPSLGLACYGHHIPLASSATALGSAPIQGNFQGNSRARMDLQLEYKYSPIPNAF